MRLLSSTVFSFIPERHHTCSQTDADFKCSTPGSMAIKVSIRGVAWAMLSARFMLWVITNE